MSQLDRRLADLTDLITKGTTPTTLGLAFSDSGVPFLRAQNLRDGRVDVESDPLYIAPETHKALARSRIFPGDLLLSIAGTIGRAALADDRWPEMNCNQAVAVVRPRGSIFPKFLLHWLNSAAATDQIRKSAVTATIANLSLSQIGNLRVLLPPLDEQQRIAAILDEAVDLRHKRQTALDRLHEVPEKLFIEMFGNPATNDRHWPITQLGRQASKIGSGATPKGGEAAYKPMGVALIRSMNVHDGVFVERGLAFIDETQAAKLKNVEVACDDVLLNITGASVARVCRAPKRVLPARVNQHVAIIRPKHGLQPCFLEAALLHPSSKAKLLQIGESGATRQAITKAQIEQFGMILPPVEHQAVFAARIAEIDTLKVRHRAHLAKLNALFASLQHRAFRGEI